MTRWLPVLGLLAATVGLSTFAGCMASAPVGPAELYWLMNRACYEGDEIGVRMLLKAGADPNGVRDYEAFYKSRYNGGFEPSWPINQAAYGGHAEVVDLLLKAGASADLPEDEGQVALTIAAANGNLGIVRMLLDAGADKKAKRPDDFGSESSVSTAEEIARRHNHPEVEEMIHRFAKR